jgi:pimeloyl-ACP methyl ester carboxylesterase
MTETLAATRIAAQDSASRVLVMLHGIYGRGRNWQSIARAVSAARPEYACWLVDLPHHGDSPAGAHGDTVLGLATDVRDWLQAQSLTPAAVLGHSYGGKVALALADQLRDVPLQIWVIDSTPEVKPPSGSAWGMLEIIRGLPQQFASRDEATRALMNRGYSLGVAQWMATNLARDNGAFVWKLDFAALERLLVNFFETDLWHVVETPGAQHDIHFLKASESSAITPSAVARIETAAGPRVHLHHRQGGHWIHAESPQMVAELVIAHLP